jgi:hypothetical protein
MQFHDICFGGAPHGGHLDQAKLERVFPVFELQFADVRTLPFLIPLMVVDVRCCTSCQGHCSLGDSASCVLCTMAVALSLHSVPSAAWRSGCHEAGLPVCFLARASSQHVMLCAGDAPLSSAMHRT